MTEADRKKTRERVKRIIAQENRLRERRRKMGKHGGASKTVKPKTGYKRGDLVWFRDPDGEIELYGHGNASWGMVVNKQSIVTFDKKGKIVGRSMPYDAILVSIDELMNQLPSVATLSLTTNIALLSQHIEGDVPGKSKSKDQIRNLLTQEKPRTTYTESDERLVEL